VTEPGAMTESERANTGAFARLRQTFRRGVHAKEVKKNEDRWDVEKAHEAAAREVAALLAKPDNFGRIGKLKAEYEAQRSAVQVQISMLTGRQAEEARAGIDMLGRCRDNVKNVLDIKKKLAQSIDTSERALPQYSSLRKAWIVRRNLERTIADLDAILVMPVELARIEAELTTLTDAPGNLRRASAVRDGSQSSSSGQDESSAEDESCGEENVERQRTKWAEQNSARQRKRVGGVQYEADKRLAGVHKCLLQLERRQQAALFAARGTPHKHAALKAQLSQLDQMFERVALRVRKVVQNSVVEARVRPAILVRMLQIVERQERADAKVRCAIHRHSVTGGAEGAERRVSRGQEGSIDVTSAKMRCWYAMMLEALGEYIDTKFEMMCSSIINIVPLEISLLIAGHNNIMDDIVTVKDLVEPCFPPHYRIFDLFVGRYHALLVDLVGELMDQHASSLLAKDIIDIVAWLRDYHGQLDGLDAKACPVLTDDLGALLQGYNKQIETMMRSWSSRMLDEDMSSDPESTTDGKLYTVAPIDMFKMFDQQFDVVDALGQHKSTYQLAVTVTQVLNEYRTTLSAHLEKNWRQIHLEHMMAQVNNSARCVECSLQLLDELTDKLPSSLCENIALQDVGDGFSEFSKMAGELLGQIVLEDVKGVGERFFTLDWYSGNDLAADCLCNTLWDYLAEMRTGLHDSSFRRVSAYVLEHVVVMLLAQLLTEHGQTLPINADFVVAVTDDFAQLIHTMQDLGLPSRMLTSRAAPLLHLCKLLTILSPPTSKPLKEAEQERRDSGAQEEAAECGGVGEATKAFVFSLADLGVDIVVGDKVTSAASGAGSIQDKIAAWYREALKDCPDLPCDCIARVLRRREEELDKQSRLAILHMCDHVAAEVEAQKGDLLKVSEQGTFTLVYKLMGVKPQPGAATEGYALSLLRAVTSRTRSKKEGHAGRRQALRGHVRSHSGGGGGGLGVGIGQVDDDDASHAIDIMYRLDKG
jgi:hypothetical protein